MIKKKIGPGMSPVHSFVAEDLGVVDRVIINQRGGLAGSRRVAYGTFAKERDPIFGFPVLEQKVNRNKTTVNPADLNQHIPGEFRLWKLTILHSNHNFPAEQGLRIQYVVTDPNVELVPDLTGTDRMYSFDLVGGKLVTDC
jgi:hypothetical protein